MSKKDETKKEEGKEVKKKDESEKEEKKEEKKKITLTTTPQSHLRQIMGLDTRDTDKDKKKDE
ncbi:MAG: hypothetical protein LW863_16520 [Flammeovirgaceae bacterium]|jgi:hypothetical protein|nr:hypothetical protein [Flammeovirgaceae bacterium]